MQPPNKGGQHCPHKLLKILTQKTEKVKWIAKFYKNVKQCYKVGNSSCALNRPPGPNISKWQWQPKEYPVSPT